MKDWFVGKKRKLDLIDSSVKYFIFLLLLSLPFYFTINDDSHKKFVDDKGHKWVIKNENFVSQCDSVYLQTSPHLMDFSLKCFAKEK
jgi:hypothetical protein